MSATYGGHMELSAFAHLSKRNIKLIQPGPVYVIEWQAGEASSAGHQIVPVNLNLLKMKIHFQSEDDLNEPAVPLHPHLQQPPNSNQDKN